MAIRREIKHKIHDDLDEKLVIENRKWYRNVEAVLEKHVPKANYKNHP